MSWRIWPEYVEFYRSMFAHHSNEVNDLFFKRLLLTLLCIALILPAHAETTGEYLASLDIMSQLDTRLDNGHYRYNKKPFRQNGCQPASIANALLASFGDTSLDAPAFLLETLRMLSPKHDPNLELIHIGKISYLSSGKPHEDFPLMNAKIQSLDHLIATPYVLETDKMLEQMLGLGDTRYMLTTRYSIKKHWDWLVDFTEALNDNGLGNIRYAHASLGAGTPGTSAPFRAAGAAGHYIAVYLEVAEFCETGTLYLLDSFPRALKGEPYGEEEIYGKRYEFCMSRNERELAHFNNVYDVERISPTVLKVSLKPDALQALQAQREAVKADPAQRDALIALRVEQLTPLQFYGSGLVFIT